MLLLRNLFLVLVCLVAPCCGNPVATKDPATLLQSLIDPAKLATLGVRGANSRVQKATAILWQAKSEGKTLRQWRTRPSRSSVGRGRREVCSPLRRCCATSPSSKGWGRSPLGTLTP